MASNPAESLFYRVGCSELGVADEAHMSPVCRVNHVVNEGLLSKAWRWIREAIGGSGLVMTRDTIILEVQVFGTEVTGKLR